VNNYLCLSDLELREEARSSAMVDSSLFPAAFPTSGDIDFEFCRDASMTRRAPSAASRSA